MYVIIVCFVAGFLVYSFFVSKTISVLFSFFFFSQVHVVSGSAAAFEPLRFDFVDLVRSRKRGYLACSIL